MKKSKIFAAGAAVFMMVGMVFASLPALAEAETAEKSGATNTAQTQCGTLPGNVKSKTIDILQSEWTNQNGEYQYTVVDKEIDSFTSILVGSADNSASAEVMRAAQLRPGSVRMGEFTIYAKKASKGNIQLNIGLMREYGESQGKVYGAFLDTVEKEEKQLEWKTITTHAKFGGTLSYAIDRDIIYLRGVAIKLPGSGIGNGDVFARLPEEARPTTGSIIVPVSCANNVGYPQGTVHINAATGDMTLTNVMPTGDYTGGYVHLNSVSYSK